MKRIINFIKTRWPAILITIVTLSTWYKLLGQTLLGEGYYYFDRGQDFITQSKELADLRTTDIFAKILFDILPPIFRENTALYLAFQLGFMIILNLSFFYILYYETKEKLLSFSATIFFSTSYIGLFEMLGTGNYQRFVQRVPNLAIEFLAFYFLLKFLRERNIKGLVLSYILFAIAVFLAHFSTFLLPLFLVYPIVWSLFQKEKIKNVLSNIFYASVFLVINFLIASQDPLAPTNSFLAFVTERKDLVEKVILQFASLNIPTFLIDKISIVAQPYKNALIVITIPVILAYLFGFFLVRKRLPNLQLLYLTSLIVIPILLFLNLYLGKVNPEFNISGFNYYFLPDHYLGKIDTFTSIKGDRYYLVPMFFVSIIWSSLILALFKSKNVIHKIVITLILIFYIGYNTTLIWDKFDRLKPLSDEVKAYVSYVKSIKSDFKPHTTLVVPGYFLWPSTMIRVFYGYTDMKFLAIEKDWQKDVDPKYKNDVIIISYDYKTKTFVRH